MFTAIALGSLVLLALSATANAPTLPRSGKRRPMTPLPPDAAGKIDPKAQYPETARALAAKWGKVFDIPPGWVVSHCYVESTNMPFAYNKNGNAYGIMQIKPGTAGDIVRWLKASKYIANPLVTNTLKLWHGNGKDLFNPELNVMFGTFYLRYIKNKFKTNNQKVVAGAYNQGPGAMARALADGELTEAMNEYIALIEDAKKKGYA